MPSPYSLLKFASALLVVAVVLGYVPLIKVQRLMWLTFGRLWITEHALKLFRRDAQKSIRAKADRMGERGRLRELRRDSDALARLALAGGAFELIVALLASDRVHSNQRLTIFYFACFALFIGLLFALLGSAERYDQRLLELQDKEDRRSLVMMDCYVDRIACLLRIRWILAGAAITTVIGALLTLGDALSVTS
jgi:hypothetical protein